MNPMPKAARCVNGYIWLMLIVFPLFMWNGFLDIKESKALFYLIVTGVFFVVSAFLAGETDFPRFHLWREHKFYVLLLVIGAIGMLLSTEPASAFLGDRGRYNGLLTVIAYLAVGSMIVCYGRFRQTFIYGFEISGALVATLGILNHYGIDPLHVYDKIAKSSIKMYLSTFGHVNIYTSFLAILLPVYAVSFFCAKRRKWLAVHMAGYCLGCGALLVSGSDSGFLALGMLWLLLIIRSLRTKQGRKRVVSLLLAFALVAALVAVLNPGSGKKKKKLDSISKAILTLDFERIGAYFTFNDDWGSGRGFIWSRGLSYYSKLPLYKKAVGIGPDLLLPEMIDYCGDESLEKFDVYYDNMHNELLQDLLTYGAVGVLMLLIWWCQMLRRIWRRSCEDPLSLLVFVMMLCYSVQSLVNISTMSVKGILMVWVFLAIGQGCQGSPVNKGRLAATKSLAVEP